MIACNIYIFQFFFKKTFLIMLKNILLWISNKKSEVFFEQNSGICICIWMMMMLLLMIARWWLLTFTFFNFFQNFFLIMLRSILLWISNKKIRSFFEQNSGISGISGISNMEWHAFSLFQLHFWFNSEVNQNGQRGWNWFLSGNQVPGLLPSAV